MLLPNAQDASAKTYNYSHYAPQFCCGGPYPPFPCVPSCSPQLDCGACPSHIIFIHKPPHTPTAVPRHLNLSPHLPSLCQESITRAIHLHFLAQSENHANHIKNPQKPLPDRHFATLTLPS